MQSPLSKLGKNIKDVEVGVLVLLLIIVFLIPQLTLLIKIAWKIIQWSWTLF